MSEGKLNVRELNGKIYPKGDSATIQVGTVTTGAEGTDAKVTNRGTRNNAILDFEIPRGNTGNTGNGIDDIRKTGTSGLVDTYTIYMTDGQTYNFTVTNANAQSAYTKVETNELLDTKIDKTSIVNEITDTVVTGDDSRLASLASIKGFKVSVGDLSNLTTTQKISIVSAINELVTDLSVKQNASYYTATISTNQITINSGSSATTNKAYMIHFPTSTNDQIARLSVDNGQNFYNVSGYVPQTLSNKYLEVVFDGTEFKVTTPIPDSPTQVVGDTLPIGSIFAYSGSSIPENWLLCDGRAVSRTTYNELYQVIGTTYGSGDGSTTFNLPDRRGRVGVGVDTNDTDFDTLGETGGEKTHTLTVNEMPSHSHTFHANLVLTGSGSDGAGLKQGSDARPSDTIGNKGGGQAHNNLQPYETAYYIIKAKQTSGTVAQILNMYSESGINAYSCNYTNNLLQGTSLYDNSQGISSGSFSLNDNPTNYSRIKIFDTDGCCIGEYNTTNLTTIDVSKLDQGATLLYIKVARLEVSGTTLTFYSNVRTYYTGSQWVQDYQQGLIDIQKVIGYKY